MFAGLAHRDGAVISVEGFPVVSYARLAQCSREKESEQVSLVRTHAYLWRPTPPFLISFQAGAELLLFMFYDFTAKEHSLSVALSHCQNVWKLFVLDRLFSLSLYSSLSL